MTEVGANVQALEAFGRLVSLVDEAKPLSSAVDDHNAEKMTNADANNDNGAIQKAEETITNDV